MKLRKIGLLFVVLIMVALAGIAVAWRILPDPASMIPLQIRMRLPEEVLSILSTPIPTALPAPLLSPEEVRQTPILPVLPTPSPTQLASPSPPVVEAQEEAEPTEAAAPPESTATATPELEPTATATVPAQIIVNGLNVIAQHFNNCGPANLTMVLNYYEHNVNQTQVGDALKPEYEDRNVSPDEMVAYVESQTDLRARVVSGGNIGLLKRILAAGLPVIVEKGFLPSESLGWMGHYLTLFGYSEAEQVFYSMDSYLGPWDSSGRSESYQSVEDLWEHFNYTFIVVSEEKDEELVADLLGDEFATQGQMWFRAAQLAQQRIEDQPENAFAYFNLGTSLTELGEITGAEEFFENAALAFDRAREIGLPWRMLWYQFAPYRAYLEVGRIDEVLALTLSAQSIEETHLYRGHALLASGDERGAANSYRLALQMNPNFDAARLALDSMES